MRLFVSLRPPPAATGHLARALAGLRTTRVEQWHLTLAFLGEVPDAEPLRRGLAAAATTSAPLVLRLRGGGTFRGAGVLYAGVAGDLDGLHALAADVRAACRHAGLALDARPFRPHLTVARRLPPDPGVLAAYEGPSWTASELELVLSRSGRQVEHEVLDRWSLTG